MLWKLLLLLGGSVGGAIFPLSVSNSWPIFQGACHSSSGVTFLLSLSIWTGFVLLDISCTDLFASCPCSYQLRCIRNSQFHYLHVRDMDVERPIFVGTDSSEWPDEVIYRADCAMKDATGKCVGLVVLVGGGI